MDQASEPPERAPIGPTIGMLFGLLVLLFLMEKVVPTFEAVFVSFNEKVPASTAFLIAASDWLLDHQWVLILFIGLVLVAIILALEGKIPLPQTRAWVVVLGIVMGFVIVSLFLPMFYLGNAGNK